MHLLCRYPGLPVTTDPFSVFRSGIAPLPFILPLTYLQKVFGSFLALVIQRQNMHPYAVHIATILTKKYHISSFFEDFRQKNSRTQFPVHTSVWRLYNPAALPGHAERASHGSIVAHIAPVLHGRIIRLCVSAFTRDAYTDPNEVEADTVNAFKHRLH